MSTILKYALVAVAAVALDNQTGIITLLASKVPFIRELFLPGRDS